MIAFRPFCSSKKSLKSISELYHKSKNNFSFLVANIPHEKVYVRREYLTNFQSGHGEYDEGVWITCKAKQDKALLFETMLIQYGALYDKLPISAFLWKTEVKPEELLPLDSLQLWNCLSYNISIIQKSWLKGLHVDVLMKNGKFYPGKYLFTIDFCANDPNTINTTESEKPDEHKSANIIKLDNGQFASQPNNRILWRQASQIPSKRLKPFFKTSTVDFQVEMAKWDVADSDEFIYLTKEEKKAFSQEDKKEVAEGEKKELPHKQE